jgi:phenylacetate-CoA ligase
VRVEAHDEQTSPAARAELAARLAFLVKSHVGVSVDVEVTEPHALERSLGKARRIDDRRQLDAGG